METRIRNINGPSYYMVDGVSASAGGISHRKLYSPNTEFMFHSGKVTYVITTMQQQRVAHSLNPKSFMNNSILCTGLVPATHGS